ncbi:DoxX family protein [Aquimarina sp. LLG6339-5]|uniref:DoxX family protein n=1 Tax=Aquimarina sp. LLG6339-5 TaxID=3160830 RepID=UPI00386F68C2
MKTNIKHKIFSSETSFLSKDYTLLFFRVLVSISMINTHGMKKLLNFEETIKHIPDPMGVGGEISAVLAIVANIVAPLFVILGLGTRLATIPILSVTLMGFFIVHGNDPWAVRDVPLMYSLAYLLIFFMGAGKYSLDNKFFKTT